MDNVAIAHRLKALGLAAVGLLFALVLGWNIGAQNYPQLVLGAVLIVGACISLFSGRVFWVLTLASSFLGGTFPILGGSFTPFQILMAIGVAKFLVGDVVLRRTSIKIWSRLDVLLVAGFMAILTWHGVHDRFGMRFLGSSVWGGRNYINVYVGLAAFFVIQSIPVKPQLWAKLPYYVFAFLLFDLFIAVITTIFPGSIYKIYPFYSAVSVTGIEALLTRNVIETARVGPFGNVGLNVVTLVLASTSVRHVIGQVGRLLALLLGCVGAVCSSYRSSVFGTLAVMFVAAVRDLRFAVVAFLPIVAAMLLGLSVVNSELIRLPKPVQRSLSFVPGNWDVDMKRDATASTEWRTRVWRVWQKEYFPRQPLLGRGFGFNAVWAQQSVYKNDPSENRQMVEVGNLHNGFFSALDNFGIIGTIFFVIWNMSLLVRCFRVKIDNSDPAGNTLPFLALFLGGAIICFWMGAPNVGTFLPRELALAGLFLRLLHEPRQQNQPIVSSELVKPRVARIPVPVRS